MALTLRLTERDAELVRRVLRALARSDACEGVLFSAQAEWVIRAPADATDALVRIANYIETVEKAG